MRTRYYIRRFHVERVVFWYDGRHRNDGPPLFLRQAALRHKDELGLLDADHKIPLSDYERWGKYDINIWPDFGEDGLGEKYVSCPGPNRVYWCSDSHLGMEYRLEKAKEFDFVFLTIPRHIETFKKHLGHERIYWLPHAGEPTCYAPVNTVKRYDVCFIGHLPNAERISNLNRLFAEFPNFYYGQKFFEEASRKYAESKIVFNHCIDREANMRVFEGTLSGSMLLTSYGKDIKDLGYQDGVHLAFYRDEDEMLEKARYYVSNDAAREKIARAGREHTMTNHTYLHRVKEILKTVREGA